MVPRLGTVRPREASSLGHDGPEQGSFLGRKRTPASNTRPPRKHTSTGGIPLQICTNTPLANMRSIGACEVPASLQRVHVGRQKRLKPRAISPVRRHLRCRREIVANEMLASQHDASVLHVLAPRALISTHHGCRTIRHRNVHESVTVLDVTSERQRLRE